MSTLQRYQDIDKFFNTYYDMIINTFYNNNGKKVHYETRFIGTLFSNLNNLQPKNCNFPISNISYSIIMLNSNNISGVKYLKSDIIYICTYFQHVCVFDIYTEMVKALTDEKYIVTQSMIDNNFNLEKHRDQFVNLMSDATIICKSFIPQFYNVSLNKILINIYSIYDSNYEEYINKNREFEKLLRIHDDFINKHNLYSYKKNFNFNLHPIKYYNFIISPTYRDDNLTYEKYIELYNTINNYLVSLTNINKIKNKTIKLNKSNIDTKKKSTEEVKVDIKKEAKVDNNKDVINKKPKKKTIPVALKRNVWNKWIGEDIGKSKCLCCKLTEITMLNFACGHVIAEANGGELKLNNLKPICMSCNSSMGTQNMDEYINKYGL